MSKYKNISDGNLNITGFTIKPGDPIQDYPEGTKEHAAVLSLVARGYAGTGEKVEAKASAAEEVLVVETPVEEAPVEEAKASAAEEVLVVETPVEEAPVEEVTSEEIPAEVPTKTSRKNAAKN